MSLHGFYNRICVTVGVSVANGDHCPHPLNDDECPPVLSQSDLVGVFDALTVCLQDYTINRRGDIGAVVREEAMTGVHTLTTSLFSSHPSLITPDM